MNDRPQPSASVRASPFLLVIAGFLAGAGCVHRTAPSVRGETSSGSSATLLARAARSRMVHIYVDATPAAEPAATGDPALAQHIALSLRDLLRERGFDVRGAETARPQGEPGAIPPDLARALGTGEALPAVSRAVTYLHPNAPRLILFVRLDGAAGPTANEAPKGNSLGAFLADSADGTILWSGHVATKQPLNDARLRLLASELLASLPRLPAT